MLKVGNTVKIRQWDDMANEYGIKDNRIESKKFIILPSMKEHCGQTMTIKSVFYDETFLCEGNKGLWHKEMIECFIKEKEYQPKHAKEMVNHPSHYNKGIETIDYIESWGMNFNAGNVVKYVTRSPYKGKELEDLKKARFYLDREIARVEKENEN